MAPLRHRDFRLLITAFAVSASGSWAYNVALAVFIFEQTGVVEGKIQGRLKPTGIRPKFVEKFEVMGINLPPGLFGFAY